jgi:hypothetical protein
MRTKIEHGRLRITTTSSSAARDITGALMPARMTPSYLNFEKAAYPWKPGIDYRAPPQALSRRQERDCAPLAVQNAGYRKTQRESDLQNVYRLFRRRRLRRR